MLDETESNTKIYTNTPPGLLEFFNSQFAYGIAYKEVRIDAIVIKKLIESMKNLLYLLLVSSLEEKI